MNKINKMLAVVITAMVIENSAYAANKTWVTDSLNAGDSRADLSYATANLSPSGPFNISGTSVQMSGKFTASALNAAYLFGVTDRLNVGIGFVMSNPQSYQWDYTVSPNSYTTTDKYDGTGDPTIGAQYLLMDRNKESMGWVIAGTFTPATGNSNADVTEIKTNGVVTTSGATGGAGNGYTKTNVSTTLSLPIMGVGDVFGKVEYIANGSTSSGGVSTQYGNQAMLTFGVEDLIGDKTTVRPYVRFTSIGSGTSGTTQIASYTGYDLGLMVTNDISKNISVSVVGEYNSLGNLTLNYANGNVWTYSGSGYTVGLGGNFFF